MPQEGLDISRIISDVVTITAASSSGSSSTTPAASTKALRDDHSPENHSKHYENVKRCHQRMHEHAPALSGGRNSRSALRQKLRCATKSIVFPVGRLLRLPRIEIHLSLRNQLLENSMIRINWIAVIIRY